MFDSGFETVSGFLIGFTAACEIRGYPAWLNRTLLSEHLVTARAICDGEPVADDALSSMLEFAEKLQQAVIDVHRGRRPLILLAPNHPPRSLASTLSLRLVDKAAPLLWSLRWQRLCQVRPNNNATATTGPS